MHELVLFIQKENRRDHHLIDFIIYNFLLRFWLSRLWQKGFFNCQLFIVFSHLPVILLIISLDAWVNQHLLEVFLHW
jgi:hypothetical protein